MENKITVQKYLWHDVYFQQNLVFKQKVSSKVYFYNSKA